MYFIHLIWRLSGWLNPFSKLSGVLFVPSFNRDVSQSSQEHARGFLTVISSKYRVTGLTWLKRAYTSCKSHTVKIGNVKIR
ncbi:hypothetical protein LMQOC1_70007 [Listeria monocytogenes QOC1]|nr:hypothetical protein pLIS55_00006 [Listeria monocytogenes]CDK41796.1 hypothetical protein LMQOC1_70007 [Listeria monocytogenes QOC1]